MFYPSLPIKHTNALAVSVRKKSVGFGGTYSELTSRFYSYFIIAVLKRHYNCMILPITRCLGPKRCFPNSILTANKPVAVKVLVSMCTQLTNRTINVRTRIGKDQIVVLFHLPFFVFILIV